MSGDPIDRILADDVELADTGNPVTCPIRSLLIEPSLHGREQDLLKALAFPAAVAIVCDANTYDVLGKRLAKALRSAQVTMLEAPKADEATADHLAYLTRHAEALIAVGSGTLNDLTKYVSHRRRQPYAVFATAPSMNGYVTATASISRDGEKLSLPAAPPKGAFFDLGVLASAPHRLIRAGVGDSLCRSTAECDWLLAHQLFDTPFLEAPFQIQREDEAALLDRIGGLERGDLQAVKALTRLLVLGGLGMLIAGSSQPGSQGEHLISHYIDMLHRPHPGSLHGEQVGLTTRTMAALQHHVMSRENPPRLAATAIKPGEIGKRFGPWSASCEAALRAKALSGERLEALNTQLDQRWPELRAAFDARSLPLSRMEAAFDTAGLAAGPHDLGIDPAFYREAVLHARELRDRFTMLDLAADAGMLASFVDERLADTQ
ncbi:MAG: iron-containing alcohol dehydrogenase [Alphaproteobacteria bacterium]